MSRKTNIKYRNELKYVCSEADLQLLKGRIGHICKQDSHVGESGIYTVRSLYFDDLENTCFYENENGTDPREKFRIRIYNGDLQHITLECKHKCNSKNFKESCPLTWKQCDSMIKGTFILRQEDTEGLSDSEAKLLRRFFLQYNMRPLRPKIIVQYERMPFVYGTGNVRVTFDRNISVSRQIHDFGEKDLVLRPIMPVNQHVLEVKYDELLPDFLYNALQIKGLRQTAFSKYYLGRKFSV